MLIVTETFDELVKYSYRYLLYVNQQIDKSFAIMSFFLCNIHLLTIDFARHCRQIAGFLCSCEYFFN